MSRKINPLMEAVRHNETLAEARKLLSALAPKVQAMHYGNKKSAEFIEQMAGRIAVEGDNAVCTERQLDWLRNLADQYKVRVDL